MINLLNLDNFFLLFFIYIYIYIYMVLDATLLNTQHFNVCIKGKVEQSREGVAPSPTPWCSSYRKWSLRVTLDYSRLYIYIYILVDEVLVDVLEIKI